VNERFLNILKAIKQAKIFAQKRVNLESVIPLETPFSVEIDISSVCNFSCKFCFQHDKNAIQKHGVKLGIMDFGLFQKLMSDLKEFQSKPKKLRLFEFGEPLLNKDIALMIKYAKDMDVAEQIEITTNGTLLTNELSDQLMRSGLDRINISIEALTDEKYYDITGSRVDYNSLVDNIKYLYHNKKNCVMYIKIVDIGLEESDKELFYATFGDICDEIFIEHVAPIWGDSDSEHFVKNHRLDSYGNPVTEKEVCTFIFTRFVVNFDGTVVACCVDWKREMIVGDAKLQSLKEIWTGIKLRELQKSHLRKTRRDIPLCRNCSVFITSTVDNIDKHADELLLRMEEREIV
jgi:radical SAM protein with 4Fe4S-binding SPASM domain